MAQLIERGERFAHLLALELRGAIKTYGFSATKVAEAVGKDYSTFYRYFTGKYPIPSDTFGSACEHIGVAPQALVERAHKRLLEELGPYQPVDAEVVALYTPPTGIPVKGARAAKKAPRWREETDQ